MPRSAAQPQDSSTAARLRDLAAPAKRAFGDEVTRQIRLHHRRRLLEASERFVYLENQFLWSPEISAVLADKIARPPSPGFRVLVVLPVKPNSGVDDTRGVLGELLEADAGAGRIFAATLFARAGNRADPIYVHAKVGIVDDRWLTIGSANLNEHSLFNDTELNIVTHDPQLARETRLRL